jgi:hypothetical protein
MTGAWSQLCGSRTSRHEVCPFIDRTGEVKSPSHRTANHLGFLGRIDEVIE